MPRRTKIALLVAAAGVLLLVATWAVALHLGLARRIDRSILSGFLDLHYRRGVDRTAKFVAGLCNPTPYVFLAGVPVLVAVLRGRPRTMLAVGAVLVGANFTTEMLKPALATYRPDPMLGWTTSMSAASWPSGHATAAMSLALCCVMAAPARLRPAVAALGAAFSVAVCYSFLALGWHYPSDVFGGFLVAGTWTALAVAAVSAADARWPRRTAPRAERFSVREALAPQAALIAGVLLVAGLIALVRPHAVVDFARGHEAFMLGAAAIGVLALALASAITLAMRR